jgi:PTS system fructose-specific IIC component
MTKIELTKLIHEKNLHILKAQKKDAVLKELVQVLKTGLKMTGTATILKEIMAREAENPTGFGHGVAIPHYTLKGVKNINVVVGISKKGVDYDSTDGIPVKIVFLIIAGEKKEKEYLQLVAKLVNFVNRENLILQDLDFNSKELFLEHLEAFEKNVPVALFTPQLEGLLRLEEIKNQIRTLLDEEKNRKEKKSTTLHQLIKDLKTEQSAIEAKLEISQIERVNRLEQKYNGHVTAKIFNNACSFCFSLPSSLDLSNIQKGKVVYCYTCGKILYFKHQ